MHEQLRATPYPLPPVLRLFCVGSALLTLASLLAIEFCRHALHWVGFPYGMYLLPGQSYIDFTMFTGRFRHFHSTQFFAGGSALYMYPAPIAPLYKLFFLLPHPRAAFLLFIVCIVSLLGAFLARSLLHRGVSLPGALTFTLISIVFSYPAFFVFNRANMEIFVWLFSATGICLVLRNRPWLGAVFIGVAASMKFFPFIYFALLLARRQYRQAVFGCIAAGVVTLASLWAVCPDLHRSIAGIQDGLRAFGGTYVGHYRFKEIGVDHSLFALLKRCVGVLPPHGYDRILSVYLVLAAIAAIVVWFRFIRHLPAINQVLCLAIACILLPPTSYDYTLLHLYTPWAILVLFAVDAYRARRPPTPGLTAVFICFTVLMSQVGEFIVRGERVGGQIKAVTLVVLFVLALRFPFVSAQDDVSPAH